MSGYRPCYTVDEDLKIIRFIIETRSYYSTRGRSFWEDLENVGIIDRTWQSLKERYDKHILPRISDPKYKISPVEKKNLQLADYQLKNRFCEEEDSDLSEEGAVEEDSDSNEEDAVTVTKNGKGGK